MQTVTVTIGRNVGNEPMDQGRWYQFQAEVRQALTTVRQPGSWAETHVGSTEWDGVHEYSAKLTILDAVYDESDLAYLRGYLQTLARDYEQDAIALAVATSELISPERPTS